MASTTRIVEEFEWQFGKVEVLYAREGVWKFTR
jgi:hypothetical protein